jgi:hypothetical protein
MSVNDAVYTGTVGLDGIGATMWIWLQWGGVAPPPKGNELLWGQCGNTTVKQLSLRKLYGLSGIASGVLIACQQILENGGP